MAVVIPFYQRSPGVLARALESIAAQDYPKNKLHVLVVDDGSPHSARTELELHRPPPGLTVEVVVQENAGPGAARNAALSQLPAGTEIVAFLDSDDEWVGPHLRRAAYCLSLGYTAYFTNLYHLGDSIDEFKKAGRVDTDSHPPLQGDSTLREYRGDMIHQIATANIVFMPTLVISAAALGGVRFPAGFKHGGEDYLYWMALVSGGARFSFSTEPEVRCGPGVNMWSRSGWGTDGLARRVLDEARFRQKALRDYARDTATKDSLKATIAELQVSMLRDVLHRLRRGKTVEWPVVRRLFAEIPPGLDMLARLGGRRPASSPR